jgi:recombination protein RecA
VADEEEKKDKKPRSLEAIIADLHKNYGMSLPPVKESGIVHKLMLTSPQLNYAFGGGFPLGRISEFYGPESGGKTVLSSYIGGQIQRRTDAGPNEIVFVDMEHAFDATYAERAGLDTSKNFTFIRPLHGEEGFTIVEELVKTGKIGLVIWDSIASTPSASEVESEFGKACVGPDTEVCFRVVE